MSIDEIIEKAVEEVKNLPRFAISDGLVKSSNLASPRAQAFVVKFITLCEQNGVKLEIKENLESFVQSKLSVQSIDDFFEKGNFQRRTLKQKAELIQFASGLDLYSGQILCECVEKFNDGLYAEIGFSEKDKVFIYGSSIVRDTVVKNKKELVASSGEVDVFLDEVQQKEIAIKMIKNQEYEAANNDRPLTKTLLEEDKNNRKITIVIGAPGSGKSTFTNQLKADNYISIDLDDIAVEIASRLSIQVSDYEDKIYAIAKNIADIQACEAISLGYNICIEKIGHSSDEIKSVVKHFDDIVTKQGLNCKSSLLCSHVSKETSVVRSSQRTMDQIMQGKKLRYYDECAVYSKDNSSLYSYLELLKLELEGGDMPIFDSMKFFVSEGNRQELSSLELNEKNKKKYKDMIQDKFILKKYQEEKICQTNKKTSTELENLQFKG